MERNYASSRYVNYFFGLFCANRAINTNRNASDRFLFLAPIAGIVLVNRDKGGKS